MRENFDSRRSGYVELGLRHPPMPVRLRGRGGGGRRPTDIPTNAPASEKPAKAIKPGKGVKPTAQELEADRAWEERAFEDIRKHGQILPVVDLP